MKINSSFNLSNLVLQFLRKEYPDYYIASAIANSLGLNKNTVRGILQKLYVKRSVERRGRGSYRAVVIAIDNNPDVFRGEIY